MDKTSYSALDREIFTLAAVWDLVGSMVHYGHFMKNHGTENTELKFATREASKLYLIILADFLSLPHNDTLGLSKPNGNGSMGKTYLGLIKRVVDAPMFKGDIGLLASSIKSFAEWLDGMAVVEKVWLPSIDCEATLTVNRMTYLYICGTATKHGFTRLNAIVKKICSLLKDNYIDIDEGQGYLVIPEFQEWFQDHVFLASTTLIAWHLNEIRWGIYHYLSAEFKRAYRETTPIGAGQHLYTYDEPVELTHSLVKSMYWNLMNEVRTPPYFPRFSVDLQMRNRY